MSSRLHQKILSLKSSSKGNSPFLSHLPYFLPIFLPLISFFLPLFFFPSFPLSSLFTLPSASLHPCLPSSLPSSLFSSLSPLLPLPSPPLHPQPFSFLLPCGTQRRVPTSGGLSSSPSLTPFSYPFYSASTQLHVLYTTVPLLSSPG